jgi:CBS domain
VVLQVKGANRTQTLIKLINERLSGRNLNLLNVRIRDVVDIFNEAPEAGAVRGDERRAAFHEQRLDALLPIGEHACNCVLKVLAQWKLAARDHGVFWISPGITLVPLAEGGGTGGIAPPPLVHLFLAVDWVGPDTPFTDLAKLMCKHDIGAIPIGENNRLIGMVTDRDIVCKGLAEDSLDARRATAREVVQVALHFRPRGCRLARCLAAVNAR